MFYQGQKVYFEPFSSLWFTGLREAVVVAITENFVHVRAAGNQKLIRCKPSDLGPLT